MRAIVVALLIVTGLWPVVGLYILAALLMKSRPATHLGAENDLGERMKRRWKRMERRIRSMEEKITPRERDWDNRFHGYE
jgi:phage shock protein C